MTNQPQAPKYSIDHLFQYIGLAELLTGEKPTSLILTPDFYTWFVQSTQAMAEAYNLTSGFKNGKVMFNGIELLKKVKIATS